MTDHASESILRRYVEGSATPEEIALVEDDEDLVALAENMRTARQAIAQPVSVDPSVRESILAAAMAEAHPKVASLSAAREKRSYRRPALALVAAAAAVVLAGSLALFPRSDDTNEVADVTPTTVPPDDGPVAAPTTPSTTEPEIMANIEPDEAETYVFEFGDVASVEETLTLLAEVRDDFDLSTGGGVGLGFCNTAAEDVLADGEALLFLATAYPPDGLYEIYGVGAGQIAERTLIVHGIEGDCIIVADESG